MKGRLVRTDQPPRRTRCLAGACVFWILLAASPGSAKTLPAESIVGSQTAKSLPATVSVAAIVGGTTLQANADGSSEQLPHDDEAGDVVQLQSPITFGRALDLQGSPVRLAKNSNTMRYSGTPRSVPGGPFSVPVGSPVRSSGISSGFGSRWHPILGGSRFHAGIDLPAPAGSQVVSTATGLVIAAGWCGGYGQCVVIDHGGGYTTVYGHLSRIDVQGGQNVGSGQYIGLVGSTGLSTGPHLHYEVRFMERPINPLKFL